MGFKNITSMYFVGQGGEWVTEWGKAKSITVTFS